MQRFVTGSCLAFLAALATHRMEAAPGVVRGALVSKWGRFEKAFTSTIGYSNPLQSTTLRVTFTSPLGETNLVYGFWDGERTWKVRFAPNVAGKWSYVSACSDPGNK